MNHYLGVGQNHPLALGTAGQQEGAHAGSHAQADGGHVAFHKLHGVVNSHAGGHGAPGAVDVKADVLARVFRLQEQKLGGDQGGGDIIHILA